MNKMLRMRSAHDRLAGLINIQLIRFILSEKHFCLPQLGVDRVDGQEDRTFFDRMNKMDWM
jgi:hypothetical protein